MKRELEKFFKLRDRYFVCVDTRISSSEDGFHKGRDFVVEFTYHYAERNSFLVNAGEAWVINIPSYIFEHVQKSFKTFKQLVTWFEKYVEKLEDGQYE